MIVVRRTAIEFYSVDTIQNALQSFQHTLNISNKVFPTQSISYPANRHVLRATFLNTPLHWLGIPYCGPDSAYLGLDRDGDSARTMHVVYPNATGGAGCRFTLSPAQEMLDVLNGRDSYSTTLCMWGETGRRMVHVGDVGELCVVGLSVPVGFGAERFAVPVEDRCVGSWKIPYSRRDLARYLAFDEATGVCAVALASGRIWIADPARGSVFEDSDAPIKKIKSVSSDRINEAGLNLRVFRRTHRIPIPRGHLAAESPGLAMLIILRLRGTSCFHACQKRYTAGFPGRTTPMHLEASHGSSTRRFTYLAQLPSCFSAHHVRNTAHATALTSSSSTGGFFPSIGTMAWLRTTSNFSRRASCWRMS